MVIVEDHPVFREGLSSALSKAPELRLQGCAGSLAEAYRLLAESEPDVLLLDLGLPDGSGLDLLSSLRAQRSRTAVLVLTMTEDRDVVLEAVRKGARGYLLKGAGPGEIVAPCAASRAAVVLHGQAADVVLLAASADKADPARALGITEREADVLRLVALGLGNAAIAEGLGLSAKTVRNQVSTVLSKLRVSDRTAAGQRAREAGIL